jgi:TRAP-type mannitol/chloroaromatic compound transport system permease large subunit
VAFSLSALGLLCGFFAVNMGWFPASFMATLPLNVFGIRLERPAAGDALLHA